jgi:antibiotic biosynthesis monooxygenase (ABM) superfamily enzyme
MHSFDPKIAKRVGVNAAVLYQNIVWWCAKNAANRHNEHGGRFWTYNSVKAWAELFPYLTSKQIRSALDRLEAEGLIVSGIFNVSAYDRTKWYSPSGKPICPQWQMKLPRRANLYQLVNQLVNQMINTLVRWAASLSSGNATLDASARPQHARHTPRQ